MHSLLEKPKEMTITRSVGKMAGRYLKRYYERHVTSPAFAQIL